jgi:hypothetical protein
VDVRTVAGRLGHGGGGATTLRVYAAWLSEADQRAATVLSARMPARPAPPADQDATVVEPEARPSASAIPRQRQPRRSPAPKAARVTAYAYWQAALKAGNTPSGAELAAIGGVDPSVGRRWRREWLTNADG